MAEEMQRQYNEFMARRLREEARDRWLEEQRATLTGMDYYPNNEAVTGNHIDTGTFRRIFNRFRR